MTTLQRAKLADIQYVPSAAASVYANAASTKTFIRSITVFNGNTSVEVLKLYNVPASGGSVGTAGVSNQFLEYSLATKETLILEWDYPIELSATNDSLQAVTSTASKVTIMLHGDKDA